MKKPSITDLNSKFSAYDDLLEGVQVISAEMRYLYVNHVVCAHAKLREDKLLGHEMKEVFPGIENTDLYQSIKSCFEDCQARQFVNHFQYPDGTSAYFSLRLQCVPEGVLIMSYDVTTKVIAEQELTRQNEKLEQAVSEKTTELRILNEQLHLQSVTDELTGLHNRRFFMNRLREEYVRYKRYKGKACLCIIDIDSFKQINDTYGHNVGDMVLKAAANALNSHIRESDIVARYGGEEFTLLMPDTNLDSASQLLERIKSGFQVSDTLAQYKVTFSAGIAQLKEDIPTLDDLIKSADEAMYTAKALGKNRIEIKDV